MKRALVALAVLVLLFSGLLSWHWTHRNLNLGSPEISYQVPAGRSLTGLINDLHGSAAYLAHLIGVLTKRAGAAAG